MAQQDTVSFSVPTTTTQPHTEQRSTKNLLIDTHTKYIRNLDTANRNELEYWLTAHLRLSGVYWASTSLFIMNKFSFPDPTTNSSQTNSETNSDFDRILSLTLQCYNPQSGGFSGHPSHDSHLLNTLSGIQTLISISQLNRINRQKTIQYVTGLQNTDGSVRGDYYTSECDTRFVYTAVSCLSLLRYPVTKNDLCQTEDHMNVGNLFDVEKSVVFVLKCQNTDGGFGSMPGAESHAGYTFCCVAMLAITNNLHRIPFRSSLVQWLSDRQDPVTGGCNGRPQKLVDVCYSWWVVSSMKMLDVIDYIDQEKLVKFILSAQDSDGGIADRPGNTPDIFHTLFGVAGLSLVGYPGLQEVDARYCMLKMHINKLFETSD